MLPAYTLPPNDDLASGGPSVTPELPADVPGSPFSGVPGSAGFLFFGSLAVNSKMLSRANHGAADANMPTTTIAHTPVATTMLRRLILIAEPRLLFCGASVQTPVRGPAPQTRPALAPWFSPVPHEGGR
jgi:hypothetical protein